MRHAGYLWAALVGAGLTVQVGSNALMSATLGSATWASVVNFAIGSLVVVAAAVLSPGAAPGPSSLAAAPALAWVGGAVGACYVLAAATLGPRLGAATFTAVIVAGQFATSLLVDHYGLIGLPVHALSVGRLAGVTLIVTGTVLCLSS